MATNRKAGALITRMIEPGTIEFKTIFPFGILEEHIMDCLWNGMRSLRKIHIELIETYRSDIAYTTVMTTLVRLSQKGLVKRNINGSNSTYEPAIDRKEFNQQFRRHLLETIERYE